LSPLIPNSEARLFADTVRALVDIIGVQRAVFILENAKADDVPGIHYEVQRIPIPSPRASPIPLEDEKCAESTKVPDVGTFPRPRATSIASTVSSSPSQWGWHGNVPLLQPPPPAPSSIGTEEMPLPPPPPIVPPATPIHRGILRRSSSASLNGKRVTINDCSCNEYCRSPTHLDTDNRLCLSSIPISPIKASEERSPCGGITVVESPEWKQATPNMISHTIPAIKADEALLQEMAAAQM